MFVQQMHFWKKIYSCAFEITTSHGCHLDCEINGNRCSSFCDVFVQVRSRVLLDVIIFLFPEDGEAIREINFLFQFQIIFLFLNRRIRKKIVVKERFLLQIEFFSGHIHLCSFKSLQCATNLFYNHWILLVFFNFSQRPLSYSKTQESFKK